MAKNDDGWSDLGWLILILIGLPVIFVLLKGFAVILLIVTVIGALLGFGWLWGA